MPVRDAVGDRVDLGVWVGASVSVGDAVGGGMVDVGV